MLRESELYEPVKQFLEMRGYEVKGEVRGCDLVAARAGLPTLIVELKLSFSLDLVLQGVNRLSLSDEVYLAVPAPDSPGKRKAWNNRRKDALKLCRRIGVGLIHVGKRVEVLLDPAPYTPRINRRAQNRLMREFTARQGDPNTGGVTRKRIMTAYRQAALRCAQCLDGVDGGKKLAAIRAETGEEKAGTIVQKNYYGWFERLDRGIYGLTAEGLQAVRDFGPAREDLPVDP